MSVISLPARLALFVAVLSASLIVMLYRVHKATQFTINDPMGGEFGDLPQENVHHNNKHGRRMMKENVEEEEDDEQDRPPMNIILFYADDWRHDTLGAAGNAVVKTPVLDVSRLSLLFVDHLDVHQLTLITSHTGFSTRRRTVY